MRNKKILIGLALFVVFLVIGVSKLRVFETAANSEKGLLSTGRESQKNKQQAASSEGIQSAKPTVPVGSDAAIGSSESAVEANSSTVQGHESENHSVRLSQNQEAHFGTLSSSSPQNSSNQVSNTPNKNGKAKDEGKTVEGASEFPGITQDQGDVMLAAIRHLPGDGEDLFTATFKLSDKAKNFVGSTWVIGEYVQRGTRGVMAMPSHDGLNLKSDGSPKKPSSGSRLQFADRQRGLITKKFIVKRPGFEGEELVGLRVGIFDQSSGKLHLAHVSAARLSKKRQTRRAKVETP